MGQGEAEPAAGEPEPPFRLDLEREARTGIAEAILAAPKSDEHLLAIVASAHGAGDALLLTRLEPERAARLATTVPLRYDATSRTGVVGDRSVPLRAHGAVVVVAAGTSDLPVAHEARATLAYYGHDAGVIADVGVAGLWRLTARLPEIRKAKIVIAVAGMEGALFSVLAGLVRAPVIAVPTSVGYGVATGGAAALSSALASCSPGVVAVNIDNGFGAAVAAVKMLDSLAPPPPQMTGGQGTGI